MGAGNLFPSLKLEFLVLIPKPALQVLKQGGPKQRRRNIRSLNTLCYWRISWGAALVSFGVKKV